MAVIDRWRIDYECVFLCKKLICLSHCDYVVLPAFSGLGGFLHVSITREEDICGGDAQLLCITVRISVHWRCYVLPKVPAASLEFSCLNSVALAKIFHIHLIYRIYVACNYGSNVWCCLYWLCSVLFGSRIQKNTKKTSSTHAAI